MSRTCLQLIATTGSLAASMALLACDDDRMRSVEAKTTKAEARVSTKLPPSEVSDDFLLATATVAAHERRSGSVEEPQRAQDATSRAQATLPASIDQPQIEHIVRGCREVSGEGKS